MSSDKFIPRPLRQDGARIPMSRPSNHGRLQRSAGIVMSRIVDHRAARHRGFRCADLASRAACDCRGHFSWDRSSADSRLCAAGLPGPGYIWTPGYWAYDPADGYYWVPGTWVRLRPLRACCGRPVTGAGVEPHFSGMQVTGATWASTVASITVVRGVGFVGRRRYGEAETSFITGP